MGLVSDRDMRQALPSPTTTLTQAEFTYKLGTLAIATCMTRAVVTVPPRGGHGTRHAPVTGRTVWLRPGADQEDNSSASSRPLSC